MHFLNHAHVSVKVDAGVGLFPGHSQSRPVDILVQNWDLGWTMSLDISFVSPLNSSTLPEADRSNGWCSP